MSAVRPERPDDVDTVHRINEAAFGSPEEANIVDALRVACPDAISLVAVDDDEILGHILYSPVHVATAGTPLQGMGLAPMAVRPDRQRQGIGSMLVRAGNEVVRQRDYPFIIVLGHPEYYPRFDFVPASRHGLTCQWDGIPDEAFMVLILDKVVMAGVSGTAKYRDEFDEAM